MRLRDKNKTILPDLIFSKFFLVFCVVLFFIILSALAKGAVSSYKVDSEIQNLQDEINRLGKNNQEFAQLVDYLKSESFIEHEAKLNLGFKKPGENLVVITQEEIASILQEEEKKSQPVSNPAKWRSYFFK